VLFAYFVVFSLFTSNASASLSFADSAQVGESSGNFSVGFGDMLLNALVSQYLWEESIFTIQWTMKIEFLVSLLVYLFAFFYWRPLFKRFRIALQLVFLIIVPIVDAATTKVVTSLPDPQTGATAPILVSAVPVLVWYIWPFLAGLLLADLHKCGYIHIITTLPQSETSSPRHFQAKRVWYDPPDLSARGCNADPRQLRAAAARSCHRCHSAGIVSHIRALCALRRRRPCFNITQFSIDFHRHCPPCCCCALMSAVPAGAERISAAAGWSEVLLDPSLPRHGTAKLVLDIFG
jgi:hypothetical protein